MDAEGNSVASTSKVSFGAFRNPTEDPESAKFDPESNVCKQSAKKLTTDSTDACKMDDCSSKLLHSNKVWTFSGATPVDEDDWEFGDRNYDNLDYTPWGREFLERSLKISFRETVKAEKIEKGLPLDTFRYYKISDLFGLPLQTQVIIYGIYKVGGKLDYLHDIRSEAVIKLDFNLRPSNLDQWCSGVTPFDNHRTLVYGTLVEDSWRGRVVIVQVFHSDVSEEIRAVMLQRATYLEKVASKENKS